MNQTQDTNAAIEILNTLMKSNIFMFEPWFMGIAVSVLLIIIVVTFVCALLCKRSNRRESEEAILDLDEGEPIIIRRKQSDKVSCVIVFVCLILIVILVGITTIVYEIRSKDENVQAFFSRSWSQVYEVAKQPWFISIVFGVILLIATILTIRTILQDSKTKKKYDQRTASKKSISSYRTAKRSGAYQEPWFVAFLFAVGLIIILSFALFLLIVQKEGETFMDTASRFFILEPWFFGIVVGVVLLTLVIYNVYRILRGKGENYSMDDRNENIVKELVVESQGFEEYPSKSVNQNCVNSENLVENQPTNIPVQLTTNAQQEPFKTQEPKIYTSAAPASSAEQVILPSLSLQLNEGHFYDEKQYHDEDDSMAEYGLGENDQFNDEGSFIGLYNRDRIQNYMAQFNKNHLNS